MSSPDIPGAESPAILLGSCSWTADGWKPAFYPAGTAQDDYLAYYARRFPTVEIDATFYRIPSAQTVATWAERTPPGFIFAAKVPRVITHEKTLREAQDDLLEFCQIMAPLGPRLGPLLLQFPYFSREKFSGANAFFDRLRPFLKELPRDYQWALEIRNRAWLTAEFFDLLADRGVAFTLIDHPWMPGPGRYGEMERLVTAPFSYIRWLGDRYKMEEQTTVWNRTIVDRADDLRQWVDLSRELLSSANRIYAYANNHYAGFSPATLREFNEIWGGGLLPPEPDEDSVQPSLF